MRILALAAVAIAVLCADSAGAQSLKDDFDKGSLDPTKWTKKQITDAQISFVPDSRCGLSAIEITAREGDGGQQCGNACERAELRTAKSSWPSFGQEVWYRFSFRIDGDIPTIGSARTVIGQWKGPGDGSPMLAQRFDNGVFHITVQDNDNRRVVASAEGNYDDVQTVEASAAKPGDKHEKDISVVLGLQSELADGSVPDIAGKTRSDDVAGAPVDKGSFAQSSEIAKSPGVVDPKFFSQIEVIPEKDAVLPDPRKGWVDMVYRIKPGRTDNERGPRGRGEIDIWANGKKIVSVRGNIGATLKQGGDEKLIGPYFKFGIYRSSVPGTLRFRFDEFSQATSRDGLPVLCPAK
ncbi:heparin lyase I family protein [Rhizobium sp. LjRoot254]|uniref:heparin lyase I family protein n=1 Tax=Rhizobium sp. LjRoot254 TaxID=3342297 RepID=UPI003ECEAF66